MVNFLGTKHSFSIYSTSDWHLGAPYSQGAFHIPSIIADLEKLSASPAKTKILNLNGDIADYYDIHNGGRIVEPTMSLFGKLSAAYPKITINFIKGNHDDIAEDVPYLKSLEKKYSNFHYYPDFYIFNKSILYTHGDLPISSYGPKALQDPILIPTGTKRKSLTSLADIQNIYSDFELAYKNVAKLFLTGPLSYVTFNIDKSLDDFKKVFPEYPEASKIKYAVFGHIHVPYEETTQKIHLFDDKNGQLYSVNFRVTGCAAQWLPNKVHLIEGNVVNGSSIHVLNEGTKVLKATTFAGNSHGGEVLKSIGPELKEIASHTPTTLGEFGKVISLGSQKLIQAVVSGFHK